MKFGAWPWLPSSICALGAVVCIVRGVENGWGWLLFIAVVLMPSLETKKED